MTTTRRDALRLALGAPALLALGPQAAEAAQPLVYASHGVAILGIDPVAYRSEGRAVPGLAGQSAIWKGALWRFASEANRAAFEAEPDRLAPAYGGWCAYSVSRGLVVRSDPAFFRIVSGRLFLTFNGFTDGRFLDDIEATIRRADAHWPALVGRGAGREA